MTTSMPADHPETRVVEVIQADREAAADLIAAYWRNDAAMQKLAQSYRDGHSQGVWADAFARHRLRSTDQQGMLREALERIAEPDRALSVSTLKNPDLAILHFARRADEMRAVARAALTGSEAR